MINIIFPTFKTQYILDFSHQQAVYSGTLGFAKHTEIFQSQDVASVYADICQPKLEDIVLQADEV
jgi:hypothetical protein